MKLKDTFVTQEMDGEQVMVEADGGFAGMVRSNATAAFIIDQLKTETTKEAILDSPVFFKRESKIPLAAFYFWEVPILIGIRRGILEYSFKNIF